MQLKKSQLEDFDHDGFLFFPDLFDKKEIEILLSEVERLAKINANSIVREGNEQTPKILMQVHETDSATASEAFRQLACSPRALGPGRTWRLGRHLGHDERRVRPQPRATS